MQRRTLSLLVLALAVLPGCSPSFSPLYRDYERASGKAGAQEQIEAALAETGWRVVPGSAPRVVATEERTLQNWGLYRVVASLEVVPVGDDYVRLYIHPYRKYFTGNRSKIPFLKGSLRRAVLPELSEAFRAYGLRAVGLPVEQEKGVAAR
jgi:hypothetical protein